MTANLSWEIILHPTRSNVDEMHAAVGSSCHQALSRAPTARGSARGQQGAGEQRRLQLQVLQAAPLPNILQGLVGSVSHLCMQARNAVGEEEAGKGELEKQGDSMQMRSRWTAQTGGTALPS